jgi:hypothetical protein
MAVQKSLSSRGFVLASILNQTHGDLEIVLKVMDLEDKIEALEAEVLSLRAARSAEEPADLWPEIKTPEPIQIAEFVGEDGYLADVPCEQTWINSLVVATGLDIRLIANGVPHCIGLHRMEVVYRECPSSYLMGTLLVWVIPAKG